MQKIVLMEGADGVGKTTLGREVARRLDLPYFRMPSQHENWRAGRFIDALRFDQTYLTEFLRQTGHSAVIDRAWPSEWVYSRVFRRDTDRSLLEELDRAWAGMGAWIIIPLRQHLERVRGDELVPSDRLKEVQDTYLEFAGWSRCNVLEVVLDDPAIGLDADEAACMSVPRLEFGARAPNDVWDRVGSLV